MNAPEPARDELYVDHVYDMIVVSNRLPVDYQEGPDGETHWRSSPGGLVTALEPVMRAADGAWIGWTGVADREFDPFEHDGITIIPVPLSADELEEYYEGFSNDTLWPLYHDVIAPPSFHREWWDAYVRVNRRFAEAAARAASDGAVGLGAGLPAAARAADAAREPPRPRDRLLQPHSVPGVRHLLAAAVAAAGPRRTARGRRHRLPAGRRRRQLLPRGAAALRLQDPRLRRRRARGQRRHPPRHRPALPDLDRRRGLRGDRPPARGAGSAPARSATASATPRRSCSASTASTTPRASGIA